MPIGFRIRGPNETTTFTDISEYFRAYETEVTMNAEEGSVGTSTVRAYDPSGTFEYVGHRQFRAYETTATGSNTVIYAGYTAEREWSRGDYERSGVGRVVDITLTDINTVFSRRIITGADANRPAETDVQRVQWWESSNEGSLVDDTRYLNTSGGVAMDACDYRGQTGADVLNDCAQASGKDWFLFYVGDTDEFSLWYDFSSSTNHSSPLRLSNLSTEIDDTWTFAISVDTKLRRDPSRVYSGIYLPFDGGVVYERDATTANTFALSGRDAVMPSYNVKSRTKATARAQRYLSDLNTEEDVITTTVILPAAKVNFLTAGMRVQFRATHLPGYENFVWLRAKNRTVKQISEEYYSVTLELGADASAAAPVSQALNVDLTIGSHAFLGEPAPDHNYDYASYYGAVPTLATNTEYRFVATVLYNMETPLNGPDTVEALELELYVGQDGTRTTPPTAGGVDSGPYVWSVGGVPESNIDSAKNGGFPGPGVNGYATGATYTSPWKLYEGPDVSNLEVSLHGQPISGFYGFYIIVNVRLESR